MQESSHVIASKAALGKLKFRFICKLLLPHSSPKRFFSYLSDFLIEPVDLTSCTFTHLFLVPVRWINHNFIMLKHRKKEGDVKLNSCSRCGIFMHKPAPASFGSKSNTFRVRRTVLFVSDSLLVYTCILQSPPAMRNRPYLFSTQAFTVSVAEAVTKAVGPYTGTIFG